MIHSVLPWLLILQHGTLCHLLAYFHGHFYKHFWEVGGWQLTENLLIFGALILSLHEREHCVALLHKVIFLVLVERRAGTLQHDTLPSLEHLFLSQFTGHQVQCFSREPAKRSLILDKVVDATVLHLLALDFPHRVKLFSLHHQYFHLAHSDIPAVWVSGDPTIHLFIPNDVSFHMLNDYFCISAVVPIWVWVSPCKYGACQYNIHAVRHV